MAEAKRDGNHVTSALGVSSSDPSVTLPLLVDPITGRLLTDFPTTGGTVTSVSVVTANGFAGSVANPTTTPAITLSTTISGVLKGNGTAVSAAVANTDYQSPITLTTTGTSGAATFNGTTLNIPNYTDGNAATVTVANEATDTSCFVGFFTAATGDLQPKTNAGFAFNSNTALLTTINQAITGTVTVGVENTVANIRAANASTTDTNGGSVAIKAGFGNGTGQNGYALLGDAVGDAFVVGGVIVGQPAYPGLITTSSGFGAFFNTTDLSDHRTFTFPDSDGALLTGTATQTLTNKRITKRTGSVASSATPTINTDNVDEYYITAQTQAITSMTTNLSGTPTLGQLLFVSITGTAARAITWGASFANGPVALPTTTVTTTTLSTLLKWDGSVWRCFASGSTV